jgi:hypothetical protein
MGASRIFWVLPPEVATHLREQTCKSYNACAALGRSSRSLGDAMKQMKQNLRRPLLKHRKQIGSFDEIPLQQSRPRVSIIPDVD